MRNIKLLICLLFITTFLSSCDEAEDFLMEKLTLQLHSPIHHK